MSLATGGRVGPYEIVSLLGAGGMGEVYRARDPKLNRDVALKILPSEFALDPDRLARFTREAQVLAALDHPNIGAIHDVARKCRHGCQLADQVADYRSPPCQRASRSTCVPGGHGPGEGIVCVVGIDDCDGIAGVDCIACPGGGDSGLGARIGGSIVPNGV